VQPNQHAAGDHVQALASVLYDLGNDSGVSAALGPKQAEKHCLFERQLAVTEVGAVLVFERAYADYGVMAMLSAHPRHGVSRVPHRSFSAVNHCWASPEVEQVVTLQVTSTAKALVAEHH